MRQHQEGNTVEVFIFQGEIYSRPIYMSINILRLEKLVSQNTLQQRWSNVTADMHTSSRPWQVPTHTWSGQPYTYLYISIYALCILSQIGRFPEKSCCSGRYRNLLQYELFLVPTPAPSQAQPIIQTLVLASPYHMREINNIVANQLISQCNKTALGI